MTRDYFELHCPQERFLDACLEHLRVGVRPVVPQAAASTPATVVAKALPDARTPSHRVYKSAADAAEAASVDFTEMMSLLREGASVNAAAAMVNSCGDLQVLYPLQAAMQTDNWVILQYLLDQGADANMPACLGCCGVMDYALSLGSARDLGLLVNAGGRLHEPEDHSPDWIISAFESTERCPIFLEPDRARVLLDQLDTDITLPGYDGTTLLDLTDWDSELDVHADWYQSAESEEKFRRTAQMVVDEVLEADGDGSRGMLKMV